MAAKAFDTSNPWQTIETAVKFDCQYFQARQDTVRHADGPARPYNSVRMKQSGVCVLPVDQDGCVTLVGQYRYVLGRYTWEVPGGGAPLGADPLEVGKAELREETGCLATYWLKIIEGAVSPGTCDEVTPAFVAWGIEQGQPDPDPEERLSLRRVSFGEAIGLALTGEISNLPGIAVLLAVQARLERGDLPSSLATLLSRCG